MDAPDVSVPAALAVVSLTVIAAPGAAAAGAESADTVTSGRRANVAVQERSVESWTLPSTQSAAPPQPVKLDPAAAAAKSVTVVPLAKVAEHVTPQLIPVGELVTVPEPAPAFVTESVRVVPLQEFPPSP